MTVHSLGKSLGTRSLVLTTSTGRAVQPIDRCPMEVLARLAPALPAEFTLTVERLDRRANPVEDE